MPALPRPSLQRGFNSDWLGGVFSQAVFLGNGLMAILSGLLAQTLVGAANLGPVAPFDAAATVLVLGGLVIFFSWPENFGDSSSKGGASDNFKKAAQLIWSGEWWAWGGSVGGGVGGGGWERACVRVFFVLLLATLGGITAEKIPQLV